MLLDQSKILDEMGIKVNVIKSGKLKAAGNSFEPLDDEARESIQQRIDDIYDQFIRAVASGRRV